MSITRSFPKVRPLQIGRIKRDPVSITLVFAENNVPQDLAGKDIKLIFSDSGNDHVYLSKEPTQIDSNIAVFDIHDTDKNKIFAQVSTISICVDNVTIAKGTFTWTEELDLVSKNPTAIGVNYNTLSATVEWFDVVVGPKGATGKSSWQYAVDEGYTGTEEEFSYLMAGLTTARDEAVDARNEAVSARDEAQGYAGNAQGHAESAGLSAGIATTKAGEANTSAQNAATSEGNAHGYAQTAVSARDESVPAAVTAVTARNEAQTYRAEALGFRNESESFRNEAEYFAYLTGLGSTGWHGIEFDTTVAATSVTRIGNMDMHKYLPIHSRIRHCLLRDDGTVNYYTHPNNQTIKQNGQPANLSGADGQRMIEIPEAYWRFEIEGTKRRVKLSEFPLPGFSRRPPFYVSADGACIQRSTGKLASVVNFDPDYRGGNNNAAWDEESRTLLGREAADLNLTALRNAARLRGPGWEGYNLLAHEIITWLIRIEYANLNCQLAYNPVLDANGFRQGGLGPGVTDLVYADWTAFNSQYPFLPTGIGASLGNSTGIIPFDLPIEYKTPTVQVQVPVWRGLANPFGYLWRWLDGVLLNFQAADAGGESRLYTTYDRSKFSSTSFSGYDYRGLTPRDSGYVKEILFDDMGGFFPSVSTGGSSATYFSDYWYQSVPASGVSLRGCLVGGSANNGATAGLGCAYLLSAPSAALASLGSRLCFFPEHSLLTP